MSEAMQPGPLADTDISGLKEFLYEIAIQFLFYGIYSVLVMIVLHKLWTKKEKLAAHRILVAAAISMFVASTAHISMNLAFILIQLPLVGFDPPNIERPLNSINILSNALIRLNYLIGDSIVVWRAWVIWSHHSKIHALLICCLVGSFVGASVDLTFDILFDLSRFAHTTRSPPTGPWTLILLLPLFLTNSISTLSMGYKVWEYKVEIKRNLGLLQNRRTKVERVLILLTESGSIYCLLWLSILVFSLKSPDNQSLSYQLIGVILPQLVAIYPILIILLLTLEKASLESSITRSSFSQSLQFASRPQVPTETQSDVPPDSTTDHIASVRPDPNTEDVSDSGTDNAAVALSVEN
ncbi:hypothetical protein C8J56DRAFT_1046592 [Mycena floridula]|nr:hypothetical protein C8J56DRAFT_1046592 [Mycena floridula]